MTHTLPKRILFIRPSALGDVCRSVAVVANLKAKWPSARIDWLVQSDLASAIENHPAVDRVIHFDRNAMRKWYTPKAIFKLCSFLNTLRKNNYDLVIDAQGLGRSGLFAFATRAKIRIGPDHAREFGWLGYNQKVQIRSTHTVDQMLELSEALDADSKDDGRLYVGQKDAAWWSAYVSKNKVPSRYLAVCPTSRWRSKQWPIKCFVEVAEHLHQKGVGIVVVGAPSEHAQIFPLASLSFTYNLLPEMTIGRLLAVLNNASVVLANDSASLHMAVGLHKPCVGLFGPTDPAKVGPYKQEKSVIAAQVDYNTVHYRDSSIGDSIMRMIQPAEVIMKIDFLLESEH